MHYHQSLGTVENSSVEELQTTFRQFEEHSQTKAPEDLVSQEEWQGQIRINAGYHLFSKYYSKCSQHPVHQNRGTVMKSWECPLIQVGKEKVPVSISFFLL